MEQMLIEFVKAYRLRAEKYTNRIVLNDFIGKAEKLGQYFVENNMYIVEEQPEEQVAEPEEVIEEKPAETEAQAEMPAFFRDEE